MPPLPSEAESSATGRKRGRDSPGPIGQSKRAKESPAPAKKRVGQTGADHHRTKLLSIPKPARTLVAAFYLHIRILWCLIGLAAVPRLPDEGEVAVFDQRYATMDDFLATRNNPNAQGTTNNDDMIERLYSVRANFDDPSTIAKQASRVPESALRYTLGLLAKFGLRAWRPNFDEDAYSLYNSAHRFIAIETFRQLVISMAYDHMAVNKDLVNEMLLLTRVYDHYVHHYQYNRWKKEAKYPGVAQAETERNTILSRRRSLASARAKWLKDNGYPQRIIDIVGNYDGTSDDDEGTATISNVRVPVYYINRKAERSELLTKFVRWIDERRKDTKKQGKGTRLTATAIAKRQAGAVERVRVERASGRESKEPPPTDIAIDYFDPAYFNSLDYAFRAAFAEKTLLVALPTDFDSLTVPMDATPRPDWSTMTDKAWMEKEGNARIKLYNIPKRKVADGNDADNEGDGDGADAVLVDAQLAPEQAQFVELAKNVLGPAATGTSGSGAASSSTPRTGVASREDKGKQVARPIAGRGRGRGSGIPRAGGPSSGPGRGGARGGAQSSSHAPTSSQASGSGRQEPAQGQESSDVQMEEEL